MGTSAKAICISPLDEEPFHGSLPLGTKGCRSLCLFGWWDGTYLGVMFFHFGSRNSSSGISIKVGDGPGRYPMYFVLSTQKAKGRKWLWSRSQLSHEEPEQEGDTAQISKGLGAPKSWRAAAKGSKPGET